MFTTEGMTREFRQGEILSDLREPVFDAETKGIYLEQIPFVSFWRTTAI